MSEENFNVTYESIISDDVEVQVEKPRKEMLPENAMRVREEDIERVLRFAHMRPGKLSQGDIIVDIKPQISYRHAVLVIRYFWDAVRTGASLYVPKKFPTYPPAQYMQNEVVEGFKKFTK